MKYFEARLDCRYHTQDSSVSCGAAVATMFLRYFKAAPYQQLVQNCLMTSLSSPGMGTSPKNLSDLLNKLSGNSSLLAISSPAVPQANQRLVEALSSGVPVAATIYNFSHWVLVEGVQTDKQPETGASYQLRGLWIHIPVVNGPGGPPPHCDQDDCGGGSMWNGVSKEFVTARQWAFDIEATRSSHNQGLRLASVTTSPANSLKVPIDETLVDSEAPLNEHEAIEAAKRAFDHYGLEKHFDKPAEPRDAQLVHLLDQQGEAYYLVRWWDAKGIRAFARIDRRGGWLRSAGFTDRPASDPTLTYAEILSAVREYVASRPEIRKQLKAVSESLKLPIEDLLHAMTRSTRLVWRPSATTLSPYFPVHELSTRNFQLPGAVLMPPIYVDLARTAHSELEAPPLEG